MVDQYTLSCLLGLEMDNDRLGSALSQFGSSQSSDDDVTGERWIEFHGSGISAMFAQFGSEEGADDASHSIALGYRLVAFHLHMGGHEGFAEFKGALDGGVTFGDTYEQIKAKLGPASELGGGGTSKIIKGSPVPQWAIYRHNATFSHYQFNKSGFLELVTLVLASSMEK